MTTRRVSKERTFLLLSVLLGYCHSPVAPFFTAAAAEPRIPTESRPTSLRSIPRIVDTEQESTVSNKSGVKNDNTSRDGRHTIPFYFSDFLHTLQTEQVKWFSTIPAVYSSEYRQRQLSGRTLPQNEQQQHEEEDVQSSPRKPLPTAEDSSDSTAHVKSWEKKDPAVLDLLHSGDGKLTAKKIAQTIAAASSEATEENERKPIPSPAEVIDENERKPIPSPTETTSNKENTSSSSSSSSSSTDEKPSIEFRGAAGFMLLLVPVIWKFGSCSKPKQRRLKSRQNSDVVYIEEAPQDEELDISVVA